VDSVPRYLKFLPIVVIALAVQILAPIAATWAAAAAVSDPLLPAEICHSLPSATPGQSDQGGGQPGQHDACAICCVVQANASIDTAQQTAFAVPYCQTTRVAWTFAAPDQSPSRAGSNTQARAPPPPM
jgi:Protein of unknown function (DUF2946)